MTHFISAGKNKHGLRYREHKSKTTGVGKSKRPLRYYSAVFKWQGKTITDAYGWENEYEGGVNKIEAFALQFKMNRKAKTPPFTYKEYIEIREEELLKAEQEKRLQANQQALLDRTKFSNIFNEYCLSNEHKVSLKDEKSYYRNWIKPSIGEKRLNEIKLLDLERIKKKMTDADRALQTINHIKKIIRQVYNYAIEHEVYTGALPTQHFLKKQKLNNARTRYLTPEQADALLKEIRNHSESTYRISFLSLNTGMRFGEIAALRWQHINIEQETIVILDPKNNSSRSIAMNNSVVALFKSMEQREPDNIVFPSQKDTQMTSISKTFSRAIDTLGFNEGITDARMKIVFHSLRHTCASWLANAGTDMQVIGKVLGHKSLTMTQRYSHINDSSVKTAMQVLEGQVNITDKNIYSIKNG